MQLCSTCWMTVIAHISAYKSWDGSETRVTFQQIFNQILNQLFKLKTKQRGASCVRVFAVFHSRNTRCLRWESGFLPVPAISVQEIPGNFHGLIRSYFIQTHVEVRAVQSVQRVLVTWVKKKTEDCKQAQCAKSSRRRLSC